MKKLKDYLKYTLIILLLILLCFTGCSNSSFDDYSENEKSEPAYKQYISTGEPDFSSLSSDMISDDEAEKRVEAVTSTEDYLDTVKEEYIAQYGEITVYNVSDCIDVLYEALEVYPNDYIESVYKENEILVINLKAGGAYVYQPYIEGIDAIGNSDKLQISTYQPYVSSYSSKLEEYLKYVDDSAEKVEAAFDIYQFLSDGSNNDHNYNDDEVTLENIIRFSQNNLIIWHGHGGYSEDYGCFVGTGVEYTIDNEKKYAADINDHSLLYGSDRRYIITSQFIRKHFSDDALHNSIIYMGSCSSAKDMSMVNALLDKGAMAVIGNNATISSVYNLNMIRSFFEKLTQKDSGRYCTLEQALDYAKQMNGEYDTEYGAEVNVYYKDGYSGVALDWFNHNTQSGKYISSKSVDNISRDIVLVLDRSGSMDGEPLEETQNAAARFVDTVLEKNSRVAIVSYDDSAIVDCEFSSDANELKNCIFNLDAGYSTNIYDGMENAEYLLQNSSADKKIIVLMTDGLPNLGYMLNGRYSDALIEYSSELMNEGIYIYTLGFFQYLDYGGTERYEAQQMLEKMASPGCHYEVESAEDIVFFFDDIADQIGGAKYVYIRIACPVDVTVESGDEQLSSVEGGNTRTSYGSLTYEDSEEDANEDWDSDTYDPVKILRLNTEKDYDINISGYGQGTMDYTVMYQDENGKYTDVREFPNIEISDKTKCISNTAESDATYLKVDDDGDGKYDHEYKTESNGTMEEVKNNKIIYICLGIGGGIILIGIIILIIVLSARSSKKSLQRENADKTVQGRIVGLFGSFYGKTYPMIPGIPCVIGREATCNIQIQHKKVSKTHCTIVLMPNHMYQVTDYSSNGTYYNNQRLLKNTPVIIPNGALLVIGTPDNVIQID